MCIICYAYSVYSVNIIINIVDTLCIQVAFFSFCTNWFVHKVAWVLVKKNKLKRWNNNKHPLSNHLRYNYSKQVL